MHYEQQYLDLLRQVWEHGDERRDRTGVGTRSLFGAQMRFDLSDNRCRCSPPSASLGKLRRANCFGS